MTSRQGRLGAYSTGPIILHALGGCHLNGYPFGLEKSFVDRAVAKLPETEIDVRRLAPASIRKINEYLDDPANPLEGEVVLLQMGNHESMQGGSWRVQASGGTEPQSDGKRPDPKRMQGFLRSLPGVNALLNLVKLAVFHLMEVKGRVYFDAETFDSRISDLFGRLAARKPAHVIVLASFPSTAADMNICRRRLNTVMRAAAERAGFEYVDTYRMLDRARRTASKPLYLDVLHLSEEGHEALAGMVVKRLEPALEVVSRV